MLIRSATNGDCERVRELVFTVLREYRFTPDPENVDADIFDIDAAYHSRGGAFELLVHDDGRVIGTVGVYPHSDGVCELRKMYLEREQRGKGHGRLLLQHAADTARTLGYRRMVLETANRLEDAIRLYQKFGFEETNAPTCCRCDRAFGLDLVATSRTASTCLTAT